MVYTWSTSEFYIICRFPITKLERHIDALLTDSEVATTVILQVIFNVYPTAARSFTKLWWFRSISGYGLQVFPIVIKAMLSKLKDLFNNLFEKDS